MTERRTARLAGAASRRDVLSALAGLGASALLSDSAKAQAIRSPTGRIDVHHHVFSPAYRKLVPRSGSANRRADPALSDWSPARAIEAMDSAGVSSAISSIAVQGISFADPGEASRALARGHNEYAAELRKTYPGRFGLFASLPLTNPDASLREIEYAYDVLKADGIALTTSYGDKWPGDPAFYPVFEELNRRRAVVFVHPTAPGCCDTLIPGVPAAWAEYDFDTTRAFTSFLVNGTFVRFPNVRIIFTHSGGTIPAVAKRIHDMIPTDAMAKGAPSGVLEAVAKLYYDVANGAHPAMLAALMKLVPASQVLFGTDFPFVRMGPTITGLQEFGFGSTDQEAIDRGNALRLFPRLGAA